MREESGGRRLDRRGFLGAAAGVAAAGASATAWGPLSARSARKAARQSSTCAEVPAAIPKARRGAIHFSFPASAWNTVSLFETDFLPLMKQINCNAWEFAGNYPTVLAPNITGNTGTLTQDGLTGWIQLVSYAQTYG